MSIRLSYKDCQDKIQEIVRQTKDKNWRLDRCITASTIEYILYYNQEEMTRGTLKEVYNYIEGLYMGYGLKNDIDGLFKPKTATVSFDLVKEAKNKAYSFKAKYDCLIRYDVEDNKYYITYKIKKTMLNVNTKKEQTITIPETWLNAGCLDYCPTLDRKVAYLVDIADMNLQLLYNKYKLEKWSQKKAVDYITTVAETRGNIPNSLIVELRKEYGIKYDEYLTVNKEITNIKQKDLISVTMKNK